MTSVHSNDWYRKVHTIMWYCDLDHPSRQEFDDEALWKSHMQSHPNPPTEFELKVLSIQKIARAERGEYHCPLCESIPSAVASLVDKKDPSSALNMLMQHIGDHIKFLSFISLPEVSVDDKESSTFENSRERLRNDNSIPEPPSGANSLRGLSLEPPGRQDMPLPGSGSSEAFPETLINAFLDDSCELSEDATFEPPADGSFFGAVPATDGLDWGFVWEEVPCSDEPDVSNDPILESWRQYHSPPDPLTPASINLMCTEEIHLEGFNNPSYLPLNAFSDLLDRERVTATIRNESHFKSFNEDEVQRLLEYSIRNPRVFLTLAATKLILKMPLLCSEGFADVHLPVDWKDNTETGWRVSTCSASDGQKFLGQCFVEGKDKTNSWDWDEMDRFMSKQWKFLAVTFEDDHFKYVIHQKRPLPFVVLPTAASDRGVFGGVIKLGLRAEHIKSNFGRHFPEVRNTPIHPGPL